VSPDAVAESEALHRRTRAFVAAFERYEHPPESFDVLAVDIARFQARHVDGYARLCSAWGVDLQRLASAADAPAVPTDAFKVASVFAFDADRATVAFRTSGTTIGARGTHAIRDAGTYDAAALAFGRAMLAPGLSLPVPVLVLGPPEEETPDSSLARMCSSFVRTWSSPGPRSTHFVRGGELDGEGLRARVAELDPHLPVIVLATSFALVHLLDSLDGNPLRLPAGSRVMQTGGFKGKSREVPADGLRLAVSTALGVDETHVVGEYGMTELSSQFWEGTVAHVRARRGVYLEPPWARVVPVHPETLAPVPAGDVGIARIEDLANVDSAFAVLAQDRVRRVEGGFELLGRAPGAPPRGCSIALDEMLGGR
jgi:hypothetical protein